MQTFLQNNWQIILSWLGTVITAVFGLNEKIKNRKLEKLKPKLDAYEKYWSGLRNCFPQNDLIIKLHNSFLATFSNPNRTDHVKEAMGIIASFYEISVTQWKAYSGEAQMVRLVCSKDVLKVMDQLDTLLKKNMAQMKVYVKFIEENLEQLAAGKQVEPPAPRPEFITEIEVCKKDLEAKIRKDLDVS